VWDARWSERKLGQAGVRLESQQLVGGTVGVRGRLGQQPPRLRVQCTPRARVVARAGVKRQRICPRLASNTPSEHTRGWAQVDHRASEAPYTQATSVCQAQLRPLHSLDGAQTPKRATLSLQTPNQALLLTNVLMHEGCERPDESCTVAAPRCEAAHVGMVFGTQSPAGVFVDIRWVGWRAADNPLDAFQHFSLDGACTPPLPPPRIK
jgi:hypothetical protein